MASDLGGTSKLQHPPLQCRCRAWVVLLWEKSFLFTLLISKLLNAHPLLFQSAVVIAEAAKYLFGFVTSGRVGHSNVEPVVSCLMRCTELVFGNGKLGSLLTWVF